MASVLIMITGKTRLLIQRLKLCLVRSKRHRFVYTMPLSPKFASRAFSRFRDSDRHDSSQNFSVRVSRFLRAEMVRTRSMKRELLPRETIKTRSRSRNRKMPELPNEIIVDLLTRLPCKSLMKFKCVSKQWNTLIRSHKFTELHYSRSRHSVLLFGHPRRFWSIGCDDLVNLTVSGLANRKETPVILDACTVDLIGECNGLFCFAMRNYKDRSSRSFLLWNPTTRERREVRKIDVASDFDQSCMFEVVTCPERFEMYGFGYDSSCDDYKIVSLVGYIAKPKALIAEIYKVGSRTWRKRKLELSVSAMIRVSLNFFKSGSFLKEALHWAMIEIPRGHNVILSFNLGKENVEEVTLNPYLSKSEFVEELRVFDGKLALTNMVNNNEMEIWVMNEYGVGSSFTKKVTLSEIPKSILIRCVIPICVSSNGYVLISDGTGFILYDPEKKTYKATVAKCRQLCMSVYSEGLTSPYHIPNVNDSL